MTNSLTDSLTLAYYSLRSAILVLDYSLSSTVFVCPYASLSLRLTLSYFTFFLYPTYSHTYILTISSLTTHTHCPIRGMETSLSDEDFRTIADGTAGWSGSEIEVKRNLISCLICILSLYLSFALLSCTIVILPFVSLSLFSQ